ncbi:MAG: ribosome-associated translation inhibitor RaiA [Dysgonamonadaceae bacterium]
MKIQIQSLHFDASSSLTEFITKKVSKLEKYVDGVQVADVILKVVKPEISNNKDASVKLIVKSGEFFANKTADSFEEAIDLSVEALEKQLMKFKEKTRVK